MYALQALACAEMENEEVMANLTSISLTLSQSLTQAQEKILVLSKKMQALQVQTQKKTPATNRTALDKKTKDAISKFYCWNHWRTRRLDYTNATYEYPKIGHQVGVTFGNNMGRSKKRCEEYKAHKYYGGKRKTVVEKINYNHHLSLIQTFPNSST